MSNEQKKYRVLVTRLLPQDAQERLEKIEYLDIVQWKSPKSRDELLSQVQGMDGVLCRHGDKIDTEFLEAAGPQLKVVSTYSVGYDHIDIPACAKYNVQVGNTPGVLTDATADITATLVMLVARRISECIDIARSGEHNSWDLSWLLGTQLTNKTLGVVGFGRIGEAAAYRLKAFGISRVLYHGRHERKEQAAKLNAEFTDFDTLLRESDVIVVCCALTPETRGMFNYDAFKKMKRNAIFVNTARGDLVQQDDLVRALQEGLVGGAGLDVTVPEPLPTDHPLFKFKNCVILPHVGSATTETRNAMGFIALDNLVAGLEGKKLPHAVEN
ncbi:glyoxylate reductase [Basidiobolus meristosporus CBS 931.73]|uniref:Glyoxylate reductase n=1 Tax=Basidiobolus meristosporus CBS 931.73 TaxID=1314790 RepID=A0A1Y1Y8B4_9FUNG|nr:glyoxylate reductase [Basidiobolus meristosporus CBS 931.73]|eukprot:ORX94233.1 glyoxylate reductase [Basidiobolus meristosporus CBS 931.73]